MAENYRSEIVHTGVAERVPGPICKVPEYNPKTREHYWIMTCAYHVDPARITDGYVFDRDNLVVAGALGCYHCEVPYDSRLLHRPCPGDPQ